MGRHSRKGPRAKGPDTEVAAGAGGVPAGGGRRRRAAAAPAAGEGHAPSHDIPQARGGHPEQREPGGGWGSGPQPRYGDRQAVDRSAPAQQAVARQVSAQQAAQRAAERRPPARPPAGGGRPLIPGPRREFVEAFDGTVPAPSAEPHGRADGSHGPGRDGEETADRDGTPGGPHHPDGSGDPADRRDGRGNKGRTFTGIAAAAVTTVLAVVVAGQVTQETGGAAGATRAAGVDREGAGDATRSEERPTPQSREVGKGLQGKTVALSYEEKMAKAYPLAPTLTASGTFEAVGGLAKAPGKGRVYRYRIDIEKGLGLDAGLFAEAVQKTLNDDRSWAHNGAMTFERISSGEADFVITLASPGTTGVWCAKSGLDTTQDNVSCDSAATDRVMINAYRWAQGASTFGPQELLAYRQMLINHEIGHRLGHDHVSCSTPGALAPVMQQQTKTLELKGIKCRPNPWVFPGG